MKPPKCPPAVLAVPCPWCTAPAGRHCVIPGWDRPLRHIPAHPSRFTAAGLPHPVPQPTTQEDAA